MKRERGQQKVETLNNKKPNPIDNFVTTQNHSIGGTTGMLSVEELRRISVRNDHHSTESDSHGTRYDISYQKHFAPKIHGVRYDNRVVRQNDRGHHPRQALSVNIRNKQLPVNSNVEHVKDVHVVNDLNKRLDPETNKRELKCNVDDRVYTPPELRKLPPVPDPKRDQEQTSTTGTDSYGNVTLSDDRTQSVYTADRSGMFQKTWQGENDPRIYQNKQLVEDDLVCQSNSVYQSTDDSTVQDPEQCRSSTSDPDSSEEGLQDRHKKGNFHNNGESSRLPEVEALNELDKAVEGHLDGFQPMSGHDFTSLRNNQLPPLEGGRLPPIGGARAKNFICQKAESHDIGEARSRVRRHSVSVMGHDDLLKSSRNNIETLPSEHQTRDRVLSSSFRHSRPRSKHIMDGRAACRHSVSRDRTSPPLSDSLMCDKDEAILLRHTQKDRGRERTSSKTKSVDTKPEMDRSKTRSGDTDRARDSSKTRSGDTDRASDRSKKKSGGTGRERDSSKARSGDTGRTRDSSKSRSDGRESNSKKQDDSMRSEGNIIQYDAEEPFHGVNKDGRPSLDMLHNQMGEDKDAASQKHHRHHGDEHRKQYHHRNNKLHHHGNKHQSRQDQVDDLAMTLHAEDKLYQFHKRAPPANLYIETEEEYSV